MLAKLITLHKKDKDTTSLIDDIATSIIPNDKNISIWEIGSQNLTRAFILAMLHNKEESTLTLSRFQDFCGLGYIENDRLELMKTYFKAHNLEIRRWADAVLSSSNDAARRYLSTFYAHLARAKA